MSIESNLASNTTNQAASSSDHLTEVKPSEMMVVFAPKHQVPAQLEHWLRKRQIAMTVHETSNVDVNEIKRSGARYVLIDMDSQANKDPGIIRQLKQEVPGLRVLVTTADPDQKMAESLTEAGAAGVILKRPYVADLVYAVQAASEGRSFVSGAPNMRDPSAVQITARERQVLELMANGYSNQAIGEKLSISVKTVEAHRARLFKKLGASNVADAVLLAIRVGLVMP
jgi:DNA-binding NarL/FixJ family response regulator